MGLSADLSGRTAVVTGASSGIGRRLAEVLAANGATVVAAARRAERLEELAATSDRIHPHRADVTVDDDCVALVAAAEDLGGIDILVNNAGWSESTPALKQTVEDVRRTMEVDYTSVWRLSMLAAQAMIPRGGGCIVNVASVLGLVASAPVPQASYGAAKGAVISLTRHLACEWARAGVRVNAIAPGWFPSELTAEMFADDSALRWIQRNTPMGRPGEQGELDGVLLLLASDAGSFITGQTLAVDGGWTAR